LTIRHKQSIISGPMIIKISTATLVGSSLACLYWTWVVS